MRDFLPPVSAGAGCFCLEREYGKDYYCASGRCSDFYSYRFGYAGPAQMLADIPGGPGIAAVCDEVRTALRGVQFLPDCRHGGRGGVQHGAGAAVGFPQHPVGVPGEKEAVSLPQPAYAVYRPGDRNAGYPPVHDFVWCGPGLPDGGVGFDPGGNGLSGHRHSDCRCRGGPFPLGHCEKGADLSVAADEPAGPDAEFNRDWTMAAGCGCAGDSDGKHGLPGPAHQRYDDFQRGL